MSAPSKRGRLAPERPALHSALCLLREAGIPVRYTRFSALDRFFRTGPSPFLTLNVHCGLIDLAKIFSALRYPGIEGVDAALSCEGEADLYFTCAEAADSRNENFEVLKLLYDPFRDSFYDPHGMYPLLRSCFVHSSASPEEAHSGGALADAAVLVSRYAYKLEDPDAFSPAGAGIPGSSPESLRAGPRIEALFPPECQRALLACILSGHSASRGLRLLGDSGFMDALWPELARLREVSHAKEYHPEGDVWEHTLETFGYRKDSSLRVALALLLHDAGKPLAEASGTRRFDRHAEIGCRIAEKFLNRMGFQESLVRDVCFLVRNHMLPGLIKTLPTCRTEGVMASPLFPLLLEIYRCDLSSTFRGPDGYYEACKVYRAFLKHRKNPYRGTDGKKIRKYLFDNAGAIL